MVAALEFVVVAVVTVVAGQQIAAAQDFVAAAAAVAVDLVAELVVVAAEPFGLLHLTGDLCSLAAPADKPLAVVEPDSETAVAEQVVAAVG